MVKTTVFHDQDNEIDIEDSNLKLIDMIQDKVLGINFMYYCDFIFVFLGI